MNKFFLFVIMFLCVLPFSYAVTDYGVLEIRSCYDFEADGTDINSQYDLSETGSPTYAAGKLGNAVSGFAGATFLQTVEDSTYTDAFRPFSGMTSAYWSKNPSGGSMFSDRSSDTEGVFIVFADMGNLRTAYAYWNGGLQVPYFEGSLINDANWYRFVITNLVNGSSYMYRDGSLVATVVAEGAFNSRNTTFWVGYDPSAGASAAFEVDVLSLSNKIWTQDEITVDYNGGTGLNCSELIAYTDGSDTPYAILDVYDRFDNSTLPDGTVCGLGEVINTSVGGVCSFYNHTSGLNYSIEDINYFSVSGTATENATIDVYLYGAFPLLSAFDVSGAVIDFNVSAGAQSNESSSGSARLLLPPNETTVVTFSRGGWFDVLLNVSTGSQDVGSYNTSRMHDNEFLINASDSLSGAAVSSFSVNATNTSVLSSLLNTSSGSMLFELLQGYDYNFFIDSTEFAFSNVTLSANASNNSYEFSLLPENSIFLFFYDLTTLNPILLNVTVDFVKGNISFENTSDTGEMIASDLDAGTWSINADAVLYEPSKFFVTVTSRSVQDVDVFLLNSTLTGETVITIKEADTADNIPNAVVTLQTKVGGNWVTFDQKITDLFGASFFQLEQGESYQIIIEADGFSTKTGLFVRTKTNYIITLSSTNTQNFASYLNDFSYTVTPSILNLSNTIFSITTSSPDGRIEWFSVQVLLNGSTTLSNVTGSPSGGTASINKNLSSFGGQYVSAKYLVKSVSFDTPFEINRHWYIVDIDAGNYTFAEFMEYYEDDDHGFGLISRILLLTFAAVLLSMIAGLAFGVEAALLVSSAVYLAGGFFGWVPWSIVIVVVTVLLGGLFIKGGRL